MDKKKAKSNSFIKGIIVLMASQVMIKILGFIYKVYLTNKEGFGDAGNAINGAGFHIYTLLLAISSIGVPNAISKLISERLAIGDARGAGRIFRVSFSFFAVIGLAGTLLLFFGAEYISKNLIQIPEAEFTLICLAPSVFFVTCSSVLRGYFNGQQRMSVTAASQTMEQVFKAIFTIALVEIIAFLSAVSTTQMVAGANLATTLATLFGFLYTFGYYIIIRRRGAFHMHPIQNAVRPERIRTIIKNVILIAMPITLSAIMASLNKNIDSMTVVRGLKTFLTEEQAKLQYGILSGKVDTLVMFPLSFNIAIATALVPSIAYAKAIKDQITVSKRIEFSLLITILIGLPCTVGLFLFAKPILELLFPNQSAGEIVLQLSSIAIIFQVLTQTINGALQGLGKVIIPAIALGISVIVKLILNLILIPNPSIGINGAAIACIASNFTACFISFIILLKHTKLKLRITEFLIKPILATALMGITSYFAYAKAGGDRVGTLIALSVAVATYLGTAFLLNGKQLVLLYFFKKKKDL